MTILRQIRRMVFCAGVLVLPMLADRVDDFDESGMAFGGFENISGGEKFGAVLRGIAARLEQSSVDQRGNIMCLAVQYPAHLFRREAAGHGTPRPVRWEDGGVLFPAS
jgi:hypothetical protein